VSNSRDGWVRLCSKRFMPRLHALLTRSASSAAGTSSGETLPLKQRNVDVIYARTVHAACGERKGSNGNAPVDWKTTAFASQIRRLQSRSSPGMPPLELISIGDSDAERIAADRVCSASSRENTGGLQQVFCRSVKLQPKLSARKLCHAQRLVASHLPRLIGSSEARIDLHLHVARKKRKPASRGGGPTTTTTTGSARSSGTATGNGSGSRSPDGSPSAIRRRIRSPKSSKLDTNGLLEELRIAPVAYDTSVPPSLSRGGLAGAGTTNRARSPLGTISNGQRRETREVSFA